MMIRAYLDWSQNASAQDRAEAAAMLAEVYLHAELSVEDRRDAEAALTMVLEDVSPLVRRALAVALGASDGAPRHVIAALARDQAEIAAVVLANSPMLTEAELVDHAAFGMATAQLALAGRPHVPPQVASALAETCDAAVAVVMLENTGAEVPLDSLHRLVERHGEDGTFREAVLSRGDLSPELQMALAEAAARHLSAFAQGRGWLPENRAVRVRREATESAAISVAQVAAASDMQALAIRLRVSGHMTPQLLMRAVLSGEIRLFTAALADLAEVDPARAQGFVMGRSMMGFGALYHKAGLPKALEPAFAAAVAAWQELSRGMNVTEGRLSRIMIDMVLSGIALIEGPEVDRLRALLLTYQAQAAREDARARVADIMAESAVVAMSPERETPTDDFALRLEDALAAEFQQAA
jgi:uncharacterized protein (DUF2336 family)